MYAKILQWFYDHKKTLIIVLGCITILAAAFLAGYFYGGSEIKSGPAGKNGTNGASTTKLMDAAAEKQSEGIGELQKAAAATESAAKHIDTAESAAESSAAGTAAVKAGVSESQRLTDENIQLLERSAEIFRSVPVPAAAGTQDSEKKKDPDGLLGIPGRLSNGSSH